MRRRLIFIVAFASVIGLLASLVVYQTVSQATRQPYQEIVVAAANMDLAETVTARHVKLVRWPQVSVPEGALRSVAEAEGRVVRSSIVAGEPLLEAKLAPQLAGRGGLMPMLVPEGHRGVTIKVDDAIKESGFVLPNSRVDVLFSQDRSVTLGQRRAKLVLQDVLVLAAGKTVELRDNKPVSVTTVTLALTPEEAERLALAQVEGRLTLATRNLGDRQIVVTPGITLAGLVDGVGEAPPPEPARARVAAPARPSPAPPVVVESHSVSVFRGDQVSVQRFRRVQGDIWVEQKPQPRDPAAR
ncbi:MAG: Flp pilus assembly protein CpaB [Candidatus Rokuibacteriota bacterium]